jgi:hypothetical protein
LGRQLDTVTIKDVHVFKHGKTPMRSSATHQSGITMKEANGRTMAQKRIARP